MLDQNFHADAGEDDASGDFRAFALESRRGAFADVRSDDGDDQGNKPDDRGGNRYRGGDHRERDAHGERVDARRDGEREERAQVEARAAFFAAVPYRSDDHVNSEEREEPEGDPVIDT